MSILCVGSVALDSVETPFGKADRVVGGSAVYFSAAATLLNPVQVVGVVGEDYPMTELDFLASVERTSAASSRWRGRASSGRDATTST